MIKTIFKPFFKRFVGLFISMAFVSMLAVGLLSTFASAITELHKGYDRFVEDYGGAQGVALTEFFEKSSAADVYTVNGVKKGDYRISMDAYLKKSNGRTITARVFSYNESTDKLNARYVVSSGAESTAKPNVSVVTKFAKNNNFKVGDTISIGYLDVFVELNINRIIDVPEAIYVRANNYIWSDNSDFGYVYAEEAELNKAIKTLGQKVKTKMETDIEFALKIMSLINKYGIDMPDITDFDKMTSDFASRYANQFTYTIKDGFTEKAVADNVQNYMEGAGVTVKSVTLGEEQIYKVYMANALKQLTVAAVFLPVFFYAVNMVVTVLFLNQIIKSMTKEIGVMASVGVAPKDIRQVFLLFTFIMTLTAIVFGTLLGFGLYKYMSVIFIGIYRIPIISTVIDPLWVLASGVFLILVGQGATFISCGAIFRITPKDAMISNESKRRPLGKRLTAIIDRSPMILKLGINSIAQNPRRFFVSVFSIFSAFVMILLTCFFYVSKEKMIDQTLNTRMNYDLQVYASEKMTDSDINDIKSQSFVRSFENCYYTYLEIKTGEESVYLETLAVSENHGDTIRIPSATGKGFLQVHEKGIILSESSAKRLGVKIGDSITINGKSVTVNDLSEQYFHMTEYLSLSQMEELGIDYVSSFIVNVSDGDAFLKYLSTKSDKCLTVFTSSLSKDIRGVFSSVNIFIVILILFSIGMGFVILSIMSQNALMEQKRPMSVMRAVGFKITDISNLWMLQSVLQLILSSLFAIPTGALVAVILFGMASSATQIYPFIFDLRVVLFGLVFILAVITASHIISMFSIKRWNLADNTRSRE